MKQKSQKTHRPSLLKQSNKSHKTGGHRSKGAVDSENRGRVQTSRNGSKKRKLILFRSDRKNERVQNRVTCVRSQLEQHRRLGGFLGTPPFLIAIVYLTPSSSEDFLEKLTDNLLSRDSSIVLTKSSTCTHVFIPKFKQRFAFYTVKKDTNSSCSSQLSSVLDAATICDAVIFVSDPEFENNETLLASINALGLPTDPFLFLIGNKGLNKDVKKALMKDLGRKFPIFNDKKQFVSFTSQSDALQLLRHLSSGKRKNTTLRNRRPYLMAEEISWENGSLSLNGYVRCYDGDRTWNPNHLIHIPRLGDFQVEKIVVTYDPHSSSGYSKGPKEELSVFIPNPELQESLVSENEIDILNSEQTWPTEEEMKDGDEDLIGSQNSLRVTKTVPKGTSAYQASWILNDDDDEEEEDEGDDEEYEDEFDDEIQKKKSETEEEEEEKMDEDDNKNQEEEFEDEEEYEEIAIEKNKEGKGKEYEKDYDEKYGSGKEEEKAFNKYKEASLDQMFPDEVDTPLDVLAKDRFARYRGLKSFRTSPWDKRENLPSDYSRIFQFENLARTKKALLKNIVELPHGPKAGAFIRLYIRNFPERLLSKVLSSSSASSPISVVSLLPHENKMSLINILARRHFLSGERVFKSKEPFTIVMGFRSFRASPVFSSHASLGSKHKYERFWRSGETVVLSTYAPISLFPAPVLIFSKSELIASGSLLSNNPDRLIIKRVVLSGTPFKINKRSVVARFMFFNRSDIEWFKPIELKTKTGRRGHIKEPLGTHGHMKCIFDAPLTQQDTILLHLYKRVYPKWTYEPFEDETTSSYTSLSETQTSHVFETSSVTLQLNKKKSFEKLEKMEVF